MADQDVFVNAVGGLKIQETSTDLPLLLAVLSSLRDRVLPEATVAFGEVGLAGEIRPIMHGDERLKEAAKHGFTRAIVPSANHNKKTKIEGLRVDPVKTLSEALELI